MKSVLSGLIRWSATSVLAVAAIAVAIWLYNGYEQAPWTRDGHVRADVVRVSSDVGGLITQVYVHDNQNVQMGQPLFVLDRPRYSAALDQATAAVQSAKANLDLARRQASRDLVLGELVATEAHEQNVAKLEINQAALAQAAAAESTARLNLERTEVRATVNGVVTNLDLHPGDYLPPGAQAVALIDTDSLRVEGYFEETKLHHVAVGDAARMRLMGDDEVIRGHVESIAAGIADDQRSNTANLLPAVQPTFSWVRLAQRIPVRVHIDTVPSGTRLIAGRTVTVEIQPSTPASAALATAAATR
ncbi:MAG: efflux RND transporter periplasmic adaptor subunit [Nevskia sp.]|nr:efflux RND transporter periplasmic adaptor subunit [Nevskia sp.]